MIAGGSAVDALTRQAATEHAELRLFVTVALLLLVAVVGALATLRHPTRVRRLATMGGNWVDAIAPRLLALTTFIAGAILLFSGAIPARASRLGWLDNLLPLPLIELSAYLSSVAGVGLIVLARGLQRRLDAAFHVTIWVLGAGILFALTAALDYVQAVLLSIMLLALLRSRRFFYRTASLFEDRFTQGWILAIGAAMLGSIAVVLEAYGTSHISNEVFWRFAIDAQAPRALRAISFAGVALVAFAAMRLLRAAPARPFLATADELERAVAIVGSVSDASANLVFLGDKALLFNEAGTAFIMYSVIGRSWIALGDPVGPTREAVPLIEQFIALADRAGGWAVFYRTAAPLLHLYMDYGLAAAKLGEVARVPLNGFTLEGPQRRNLRRVWRKAVDDGCTFEVVPPGEVEPLLPLLRAVSDDWLQSKRAREKGFSLGRFDDAFVRRFPTALVRRDGRVIAFATGWPSGDHGEVEVDLMRYASDAPAGIMRYLLIEFMFWARDNSYHWFNLGMAPLSGIRSSAGVSAWNQISLAVRGAGERYYNFQGLREFKAWFYPEWESSYLVSPGGTRRPLIVANISTLIAGGLGGVLRK